MSREGISVVAGVRTPLVDEQWDLPETFNMAELLLDRHLAEGRGSSVAIVTDHGQLTYRELVSLCNRAGCAFQSLGLRREERVMLMLHDGSEFLASYLGAMKVGAVPVPVNTLSGPDDYLYYLNDSRAYLLVIAQDLLPRVEPIRSQLRFLRQTVVVGADPGPYSRFDQLVQGASDNLSPAETHRDEPSYWLYSSGTTGRPKGVVHLHHDMVYCTSAWARHVAAMQPSDRTFSASRLFFSYGLVNSLYLPCLTGGSVALLADRPEPANVLAAIRRHRPTIFFAVPTFLAALLRYMDTDQAEVDLSSLRLVISAGEALPAPLFERWREKTGLEVLDAIGSSEVGYIFISNRPGRAKPGATGELLPGYEARLLDEEGKQAPQGEVGDLWIKAESTAAYYWTKHELTKRTFVGEWHKTGDKYAQDSDGYFVFAGRSDDLMKVSGQWVAPIEVEAALLAHPEVTEAAVVGAADSDGLEKPRAFVVLRDASRASSELEAELKQFVKESLPPFKYPRWIGFVAELPKTPSGKIQRYKLRTLEAGVEG